MKITGKKIACVWWLMISLMSSVLSGCGQKQEAADAVQTTGKAEVIQESEKEETESKEEVGPEIPGLTYESSLNLKYARCFQVYYYEGGYALIQVQDSARYLVVPEGMEVPAGLDQDIVILPQPLDHIYLAATSAMALFDSLDSLDAVKMSGTLASGWYIDHAVEAMNEGKMIFAGKYNEPDYELLVNEGCDLAIESTMILHSPKVKEMIDMLDIPVFIDRSSYETHPLGRTEWIKLYAVLMDKEEQAEAFFEEQAKIISDLKDFPNTEKTVAFFYISTDGSVVVKKSNDYIPRMIEIAGGRYVFEGLENLESKSSSVSMTMEEFYAKAIEADYLIYNAAIDSPISTTQELLAKSDLLGDFKAVKEGNVWCTGKSLYQATDVVGKLITDINQMLTGENEDQMTFLTRVK